MQSTARTCHLKRLLLLVPSCTTAGPCHALVYLASGQQSSHRAQHQTAHEQHNTIIKCTPCMHPCCTYKRCHEWLMLLCHCSILQCPAAPLLAHALQSAQKQEPSRELPPTATDRTTTESCPTAPSHTCGTGSAAGLKPPPPLPLSLHFPLFTSLPLPCPARLNLISHSLPSHSSLPLLPATQIPLLPPP